MYFAYFVYIIKRDGKKVLFAILRRINENYIKSEYNFVFIQQNNTVA